MISSATAPCVALPSGACCAAAEDAAKAQPAPASEALGQTASDAQTAETGTPAEPAAEVFDEIWRPSKHRDAREQRQGRQREHKPRREQRGKPQRRERPRQEVKAQREAEARRERERKRAIEHSPFAALEALRGRLTARAPDGS